MTRFEKFLLEELWRAYYSARKGKRKTVDEHVFELNAMENVMGLHSAIMRRQYKPSRGVTFIVSDPVVREIVAAPFRDRVIHHFLYNCQAEWWDRRFIVDSYSCRKGKGTLYAQQRMQKHLNRAIGESVNRRAFVVKLDLQGYFMSLSHQKLYERIKWGLDRQFRDEKRDDRMNGIMCHEEDREELYKVLLYLWEEVIYDRPMEGIRVRGRMADWKKLPRNKSLFNQPEGQGIVIGNLTSQLLSNIFMDQFDRFVRFELGYKHYGRYVDDFYIIVPVEEKDKLLNDIKIMERFLKQELKLTLHPKKRYCQDAEKGIAFVGAVVYAKFKVPGKRTKGSYMKLAYEIATTGKGDLKELELRAGCIEHLNSKKFLIKTFEALGWRIDLR